MKKKKAVDADAQQNVSPSVLGERCICGHERYEHRGYVAHLGCSHEGCNCERFTWSPKQ